MKTDSKDLFSKMCNFTREKKRGPKTVVVVGNTNNFAYMVSRAVAAKGYRVIQILDQCEPLHRPEARYPDVKDYLPADLIVVDLAPVRFSNFLFHSRNHRKIRKSVVDADAIVTIGLTAAILNFKHRNAYMIFSGSDLTFIDNWRKFSGPFERRHDHGGEGIPFAVKKMLLRTLAGVCLRVVRRRQISLLENARGFLYAPPGSVAEGEAVLSAVCPSGVRQSMRIVDIPPSRADSPSVQSLDRFLVLNSARISISNASTDKSDNRGVNEPLDIKATDMLLRGFGKFLSQYECDAQLVLVRKGPDIVPIERLVTELCLDSSVTWIDEQTQLEMFEWMRRSHAVVDNLGGTTVGMAAHEGLAVGRPVIVGLSRVQNEVEAKAPFLLAESSDDVAAHLLRLATDQEFRMFVGIEGLRYVAAHCDPLIAAGRILRTLGLE